MSVGNALGNFIIDTWKMEGRLNIRVNLNTCLWGEIVRVELILLFGIDLGYLSHLPERLNQNAFARSAPVIVTKDNAIVGTALFFVIVQQKTYTLQQVFVFLGLFWSYLFNIVYSGHRLQKMKERMTLTAKILNGRIVNVYDRYVFIDNVIFIHI